MQAKMHCFNFPLHLGIHCSINVQAALIIKAVG